MHRLVASMVALSVLAGCAADAELDDGASAEAATTRAPSPAPSDPRATEATRTVYANLRSFDFQSGDPFDRRILVGQQEADTSSRAASGLAPVTSEFAAVTGRLPAMVSYELSLANRGSMTAFDAEGFRRGRNAIRDLVLDKHRQGILVSFVWHLRCPKTNLTDPDKFSPSDCPGDYTLEELLERKPDGQRGAHFVEWRAMLDELAELLWSLKDEHGELVPVLLRPLHEHTGGWFWWGRRNAASTYAAAWREMVTYLRDGRGLHHALWVYCPASPSDRSTNGFEHSYPGDEWVDVVAFDRYDFGDRRFASGYEADLDVVGAFARAHGKAAAVAEVGREMSRVPVDDTWFTRAMLAPLERRSFAYVSLWRNAPWEKFVPQQGDGAIARDLATFGADPGVLLSGRHDLYRPLHAR